MTAIRLGTRASTLAMTQSETVAACLRSETGVDVDLVPSPPRAIAMPAR